MQTLRFLHIPKTGGTTLRYILKRLYPPHRRFEFSGDAESDAIRWQELSANSQANVVFYTGHAPIETGVDAADQCMTITMLRDPISRVQSFCRHVAEGKSPHLRDQFPPQRFDLDEFLWSGNPELSDLQTKMLVNRRHCAAPLPASLSASSCVRTALDNLFHKLACFGIQEHFDESVARFRSILGWRRVWYSVRNQARAGRSLIFRPHHRQRIMELNALDLEFYEEAVARFLDKRITARLQPSSPHDSLGPLTPSGFAMKSSEN